MGASGKLRRSSACEAPVGAGESSRGYTARPEGHKDPAAQLLQPPCQGQGQLLSATWPHCATPDHPRHHGRNAARDGSRALAKCPGEALGQGQISAGGSGTLRVMRC